MTTTNRLTGILLALALAIQPSAAEAQSYRGVVNRNGNSPLASIPGGTNTFLPTTNQTPTHPVQYARTRHFAAAGGTLPRLAFADWQTGSTGEQLNNANMVTWNHYAGIELGNTFYPATFSGKPYGTTTNGNYVLSDAITGIHIPAGATFYVFHVAIPATYRTGSGVPSAALGNNGDTYYDNVAKLWYSKTAGSWGSSSGTDPWLANSYVIPVTHYTRGAMNEYNLAGDDATLTFSDGTFARGVRISAANALSAGTLTFGSLKLVTTGSNYNWEIGVPSVDILDLSQIGPGGGHGTTAGGYPNVDATGVNSLTPTTATGSAYTGPIAVGIGNTTQAWGPSLIAMTPDVSTPWLLLIGDSIVSGVGASDGDGDQYRQFGIYQRMLSYPGNQPPSIPSMNWGVAGLTANALNSAMTQSRAMFRAAFPQGGSNVLIAAGTNDYALQSSNGYLTTVQATLQSTMNWWKQTAGFRYGGLATILDRTTSSDAWATTTNQTPVNVLFNSGGDVDTHNADILAGTLITNQDWYVDERSWAQDGTTTHAWKVSGNWTQSANSTTFPPTTDGIHPSKALMVFSATANSFPALNP